MVRACRLAGCRPILVVATLLAPTPAALADTFAGAEVATAAATTWVELFVEEDEVRLELETGVPDLIAFEGALPDDFRVRMGLASDPSEERVGRFFAEELVLRADGGPPLPGRLVSFATSWRWPLDPLTGDRRAGAGGPGSPVVEASLVWDLPKQRPATLRLEPAMVGRSRRGATVALATHHLGVPVGGAVVLRGPTELELDWQRPWHTRLGGTGSEPFFGAPLQLMLAVAPERVWVEAVARPVDLEELADIGIAGRASIPADSRRELARRVAGLIAESIVVTVDGSPAVPSLERAEITERRMLWPATELQDRALPVQGAFVRAVLVLPVAGRPDEVELEWRRFGAGPDAADGVVVDGDRLTRTVLGPGSDRLRWAAKGGRTASVEVDRPPPALLRPALWLVFAALAALGLLIIDGIARAAGGAGSWARVGALVGAAAVLGLAAWGADRAVTVDDRRAASIVGALLHDVYRESDRQPGGPRPEALHEWVMGEVAETVAGATRRPLDVAGRGRDLARFGGVELLEVGAQQRGACFTARCRWKVLVTVAHWGHLHRRVGEEAAELSFEPVDGTWKLTDWSPIQPEAG